MIVKDGQITITGKLSKKEWDDVISCTSGLDDISIKIRECDITAEEINIPHEISSMLIEASTFKTFTKISGLTRGRHLRIIKCKPYGLLSRLDIENVDCNVFEFIEDKNHIEGENENELECDFESSLILNIKKSAFLNFFSTSHSPPSFKEIAFINKLQITLFGKEQTNNIHFNKCYFCEHLQATVIDSENINLFFQNSISESSKESQPPYIRFCFKDTDISSLDITNSNLTGLNFELFNVEIKDISIKNSKIESLDCHTTNDENSPKRIYNVNIVESEVGRLLLNNRVITHPLSLSESTLKYPPQFYGVEIPHGSSFPKYNSYIRKKGNQDASCYRTLRFAMEAQRNRELEGMFFILEQESLLNLKSGLKKYMSLSYLYLLFSKYGTSYKRPLLIISLSFFISTVFYALITSPSISPTIPIDWALVKNAIIYSLKQTLQPFSSLKDLSPLINTKGNASDNITLIITSVFQSIISISCLALAGLAIRWKFKRG